MHYHVFGALLPKNFSNSITSIPDLRGWRYAYDMNIIFLIIRSLKCSVSEMMSINATFEVVYIFDESGNPCQPPAFMRGVDWLNTDDSYPSTIGNQSRFEKESIIWKLARLYTLAQGISLSRGSSSRMLWTSFTPSEITGTALTCRVSAGSDVQRSRWCGLIQRSVILDFQGNCTK